MDSKKGVTIKRKEEKRTEKHTGKSYIEKRVIKQQLRQKGKHEEIINRKKEIQVTTKVSELSEKKSVCIEQRERRIFKCHPVQEDRHKKENKWDQVIKRKSGSKTR